MILYHFTRPECLDSILRDGLLARNANHDNDMTGGKPVVWLTAKPCLVPILEIRKLALRRGILMGPRCTNLPESTVCLKTVIPTTDRRLRHFITWLRKHPQPGIDSDDPMLNADNWIYAGNIPADRLSVFKHFPPGKVYWELLTIREDWLNSIESIFPPDLEADLLEGRIGPDDYVAAMSEPVGAA
jgi:hypothetical protein